MPGPVFRSPCIPASIRRQWKLLKMQKSGGHAPNKEIKINPKVGSSYITIFHLLPENIYYFV